MAELVFNTFGLTNHGSRKVKSSSNALSDTASTVNSQWQTIYFVTNASVISTQPLLHTFCNLAVTWKEQTKMASSLNDLVLNPAYQEIIGMGKKVIPYILSDLLQETSHWFWALRSIAGVDPVTPSHRGNLERMKQDWIAWGKTNGYL